MATALTAYADRNSLYLSAEVAGLFNMPRGSVGQRKSLNPLDQIKTYINTNPQAAQVSTVTVTASPTNDAVETVVVAGQSVSYTADSSATRAEVTTGLVAALQADPIAGRAATYSGNTSTGVITCTGRNPGVSFTLTTASADLSVATVTAAATADVVPFGVAVIKLPGTYYYGSECCAVATTANLTAMVKTVTVVYAASENYQVVITVDGQTYYTTWVVANTDSATTATDLATAVNVAGLLPAYTVIAAATTGGALTLTAEVPGKAFDVAVYAKVNPAKISVADTTVGPATDFWQVFVGISELADNVEGVYSTTSDAGAAGYKPNAGVKCVSYAVDGVYVANSETPTDSSDVYISLDPSYPGQIFASSSAQYRLKVTGDNRRKVFWQGNTDMAADGIGILGLKL
mgnify:CR=1 FL=1